MTKERKGEQEMDKLILQTLKLRNFMGVKYFILETGGGNASVYGDNATGKTTLKSAQTWLLFNKNHEGKAKFEIKTLDDSGKAIPSLEHEVEGVYQRGSKTVKLKKILQENYTKKRGSLAETFTGHTTDYYVDDVKKKAGEYKAVVAELASEDIFHLLTSPTHFSEKLSWQDQREILISMFGDITDEMVISSDDKLEKLPGIQNGKSIDDRKDIIKADMASTNKQIKGIPDRIDEQTRTLPELTVTNPISLTEKLTSLREQLGKQNENISKLKAGGGVADLRNELTAIDGEILKAKNSHESKADAAVRDKRVLVQKLHGELADFDGDLRKLNTVRGSIREETCNISEALISLKTAFASICSSVFDTETPCCHCGAIPAHQTMVTESNFNEQKAKDKESNIKKGKSNAAKLEALHEELKTIDEKIKTISTKIKAHQTAISILEDEISANKFSNFSLEKMPEYIKATDTKAKIEKEITDLEAGNSDNVNKAIIEKQVTETEIAEQEKHLSRLEQHQKGTLRIEELKTEEKRLSTLYETLSGDLFLIEAFIKTKVAMMEESINKGFSLAKFKLFSEQINGGISETCEVMVNGVPYGGGLNNAAKIQAGIDIINTISQHHNFSPPIFVDNRESIVILPETEAQVIGLVVDADAKELTVVV